VLSDAGVLRAEVLAIDVTQEVEYLVPGGEARIVHPSSGLPGWLRDLEPKDILAAPLTVDGSAAGVFIVASRLVEVSTFGEDDLQLFRTLANHASVALDNGRLFSRIQHEADERAHQALYDDLSGLPNRTLLQERLVEAIEVAQRRNAIVGVVLLDLDTFKEVNDTLGPAIGDRLLLEVRDRINGHLPSGATLARFAGDQFAVMLPVVGEASEASELAETLASAFDAPFTSDGVSLALGASIGVACYPEHATTAEILLQRADAATYVARLERSGVEIYSTDRDPYAPRRLALAADLKEAIDRDEVMVFVQPKLSVADGVVRGAEALVRWRHPRLGDMSPVQFIPAAEHTGVIRALTLYVVRGALVQCRDWRAAGHDLTIAVNLSARNLLDQHLVDDIGAIIEDCGLPPSVLTLELTESTVMSESKRSMEVLNGLHDLGVGLSVDDFGTGYSSLAHLRRLPVSELKIDRSFVSSMAVNEHDSVIVRSLVELSKNLGLRTVAEGVENKDAWDRLRDFGCEQAQGFLISRPLPADQFVTWLGTQQVDRLASNEQPVVHLDQVRRK
jgi:diguanylate cyclase (GGDEF)-like protein